MKKYFVVYVFECEGNIAISNMTVKFEENLNKYEHIEKLEKLIQNTKKINNVKIISWKKLKKI